MKVEAGCAKVPVMFNVALGRSIEDFEPGGPQLEKNSILYT